jgi:hypothetical protein
VIRLSSNAEQSVQCTYAALPSSMIDEGIMPSSTRDDAEHWRRRAADMRAVAKDVLDQSKQTMLEIALSYERLAQRADEREGAAKRRDGQR